MQDAVVAAVVGRGPLLVEEAAIAQQFAEVAPLGLAQAGQLLLAAIQFFEQPLRVLAVRGEFGDQIAEQDGAVLGSGLGAGGLDACRRGGTATIVGVGSLTEI